MGQLMRIKSEKVWMENLEFYDEKKRQKNLAAASVRNY